MLCQLKHRMKTRDGPSAFAPEVLSHADRGNLRVAEDAAPPRADSCHREHASGRWLSATDHTEPLADGSIQVDDGHHRLTAIWLSGRTELEEDEYLLIEKEQWRPRFGQISDLMGRCGITARW